MAVKDVALLNLGETEADPIDWAQYQHATEIQAPPPEGRYTFQAPAEFQFDVKDVDGRKVLVVDVDPLKIINAPGVDYAVKFTRVTTKRYPKRMGSSAGDYLQAIGVNAQPRTLQEYAALIQATAGRFFQARLTHRGYCKDCDQEFKSEAFRGQGSLQCPSCNKKVYANGQINPWDFIPAGQ